MKCIDLLLERSIKELCTQLVFVFVLSELFSSQYSFQFTHLCVQEAVKDCVWFR